MKVYFGVKIPDANAPFRLMKAETLGKYLGMLPEDYAIPNIMITTFFAHYEKNIIFKNVTFKPRQAGSNSINIMKIIGIGKNALVDFKRFRGEMKI